MRETRKFDITINNHRFIGEEEYGGKIYINRVGISKDVHPHTLRHAFATHMLNNGADLRSVQMLLGHTDLSTTQIYTHIAQTEMQNMHKKHHPRG